MNNNIIPCIYGVQVDTLTSLVIVYFTIPLSST